MKIFKYIMLALVMIIGINQCKLPDNVNPKRATEVPVETLFTNAMVALFNQIDLKDVNNNINMLMVQYHQETTYFDEARYNFIDRQIPDGYVTEFYRDALMDFVEANDIILAETWGGDPVQALNMAAVNDILMTLGFATAVDAFGDLPYTEALKRNEVVEPVYDDAKLIYTSIIDKLDQAIDQLKNKNGGVGSWGSADVMYSGDTDLWAKFGASLLMRLGMRLADVDNAAAKAAVEKANGYGTFTDMSENGYMIYVGVVPHVNTTYRNFIINGRKDYLPTNTIVDIMDIKETANHQLGMQDPRISHYFTKVDTAGNGNEEDFVYKGAVAGLDGAQTYQLFSHFQDVFFEATFPAMIIDYIEVEFLKAEAVERGYNVGGTAKEHYDNAITASCTYWGVAEADITSYLDASGVAYDSQKWKERIGVQKWLATYNRGTEGWAEWRRLDFPKLNPPEGMVYGDIPLRMPYPYNEPLQNRVNYEAAVAKMPPPGDDQRTPVFWDVVPSPFK